MPDRRQAGSDPESQRSTRGEQPPRLVIVLRKPYNQALFAKSVESALGGAAAS
jgi:hypothetical protein